MPEMTKRFPEWMGFVREWDNLTRLYQNIDDEEGNFSKLYSLIFELVKEGDSIRKSNRVGDAMAWMGIGKKNQAILGRGVFKKEDYKISKSTGSKDPFSSLYRIIKKKGE